MMNYCFKKNQKLSFKKEIISDRIYTDKPDSMFHGYPNNEKSILNKELGRVIENALIQLPEDYRIVFTLRELNGMSVADTSATLNISESNVKVRLNRAKTMLRSRIEKMYSPQEIFEFNLVYCNSMVDKVMACIQRLNQV
jgi:RNA polymerase sigma-70 factor (ECF subfamily)